MKLSVAFLFSMALAKSDARVLRQVPNFLSNEDIELVLESVVDPGTGRRLEGKIEQFSARWTPGNIPTSLVDRIAQNSPYNFRRSLRSEGSDDMLGETPFHIKSMTKTTDVHTDSHGDSCYSPEAGQKPSTLIFLNTNENAVFVHGDEAVPVTAGTLVNFQADEPHQTVIKEGEVNIMVPFARRQLMPPAGECDGDYGETYTNGDGTPDEEGTICCFCDGQCPADRPNCGDPLGRLAQPHCNSIWNRMDCGCTDDDSCLAAGVCQTDSYPGKFGYCMDDNGNIYPDSDGDGVLNTDDFCPGTEEGSTVDMYGCSSAQVLTAACECDAFKNHGQYVKCVVHFINDGGLDDFGDEIEEIKEAAAQSDCSKK